jgi:membrane-associated phospholipid phosphatase
MMRIISLLGGPAVRAIVATLASLLLLLSRRWRHFILLVTAIVGTGLMNTLLKKLVGRRRPLHFFGPHHHGSSFPSGHASGAVSLAGTLVLLLWRRTHNGPMTAVCTALGASWVVVVGYSRIKLRQHYTGDVLAGYVLGLLWFAASVVSMRKVARRGAEPS